MPIRTQRQYRFQKPVPYPSKTMSTFFGMNTKLPETEVSVRSAENIRFGLSAGWSTRPGSVQYGNVLGTANKIDGLHSYVKADLTAYLLASYNGDIYQYLQSGAPATAFTSTSATALSYSKDRNTFLTTTVDTNGKPYFAIVYQSGAGIKLRSASYPYTSWSSAVAVASPTSGTFSCYIDKLDNIHVSFAGTGPTINYVKLTFSAGPTWTLGSPSVVDSTALTGIPTIAIESGGRIHIAYNATANNTIFSRYSDNGSTWSSAFTALALNGNPVYPALTNASGTIILVMQDVEVGSTAYYQSSWTGSAWTTAFSLTSLTTATATGGSFTIVPQGSSVTVYADTITSSPGLTVTGIGSSAGSDLRKFTVINSGVNMNNIRYQDVINGNISPNYTNVTTGTSNEVSPHSPETIASSAYIPVVWIDGTVSPFNIKITSAAQWSALGASLTAGNKVESCTMPFTAAGGTGSHYFVNNANATKKWDGTTLSSATATGFPTASWIFAQDNRLLLGGGVTDPTAWYYTNLGADNFTGTFPTSNVVFMPEAVIHGMWYRDSVSLMFTRTGVYMFQNFDYTGATITPPRKIPDSYGILSARTVKQVGYYVYYQRPDGQIMRTNGSSAELVSDAIFPTLQNISDAQLINAAALSWGSYYFLSLTSSGGAQNDTTIVLDTRLIGISSSKSNEGNGFSVDTGKYASVLVQHPDINGNYQPYFGDSRVTKGIVYQTEIGNTDNGTSFTSTLETGIVITGDIFSSDLMRDMLVVTEATPQASMTVGWTGWANTNSYKTQTYSIDTGASTWGTGKWGDRRVWGGNTTVEQLIPNINLLERGFKFKFSTTPTTGPVNFTLFTITSQQITDRI